VAELCFHKAHYLANQVDGLSAYKLVTARPFFNEFVVRCPGPAQAINARLLEEGLIGGLDLGRFYPGMEDHMLLCATEVHTRATLDTLVRALEEVA
jgi:glycine dehydrogenase subunit 1